MKKIIFFLTLSFVSIQSALAQNQLSEYPSTVTWFANGKTIWEAQPIDSMVKWVEFIFEGRILTDSVYFEKSVSQVFTFHKILVLKQFKGVYSSDTLLTSTGGGRMIVNDIWQGGNQYARKGDEAIFYANRSGDSNVLFQCLGDGGGFVKICDKKDIVKEAYEPLEKCLGHPYKEVHPNTCATQQNLKK